MLDDNTTRQDSSAGDSSVGEKGTSYKTPITSTIDQTTEVQAQITKAVSDALSRAGRDADSLSSLKTQVETGFAELKAEREKLQRERFEAELETHKDEPDEITRIRRERTWGEQETRLKELEASINERDASLKEREAVVNTFQRTQMLAEVAVAKGIPYDTLSQLVSEGDNREAVEKKASLLTVGKEPFLSDSGRSVGGTPNDSEIIRNYADNPNNSAYLQAYKELQDRKRNR